MAIQRILSKFLAIAGLLFLVFSLLGLVQITAIMEVRVQLIMAYLLYVAAALLFFFLADRFSFPKWAVLFLLALMTLLFQLIFSYHTVLYGEADLRNYYSNALALSQNWSLPSLYAATFPGTVTYPAFLALFMRVFGARRLVFVLLNQLILCCATCATYSYLLKKTSSRWALAGALSMALNPILIIYADTCNAELLYGSLVLLSFYAFHAALNASGLRRWAALAASALLCGFSALFRPLTLILVVAYLLFIALFSTIGWKQSLLFCGVICAGFLLFHGINNVMVKQVTGYNVPSSGFGWNLFVGASEKGTWNTSDAEDFSSTLESTDNPTALHSTYMKQGLARYRAMGLGIFNHMLQKVEPWYPYFYIGNELTMQSEDSRLDSSSAGPTVQAVAAVYDLPLFALSFLACIYLLIQAFRKGCGEELILVLYLIGSLFALMILETASRYTISYRLLFSVLPVLLLSRVARAVHVPKHAKSKRNAPNSLASR